MKIYKAEDYKEAPKKEMLLKLVENEKGSIDLVVCDEKGNSIVPILRIGNQKSVHTEGMLTYKDVKSCLMENNYNYDFLTFEQNGSIKVFKG